MHAKKPFLFYFFGAIYLFIGAVALLKAGTVWQLTGIISIPSLGYAFLGFLAAYGFFNVQRWIIPALMLNGAAALLFMGVKLFVHTPTLHTMTPVLLAVAFNGIILGSIYALRRYLSRAGVYTGAAFILLWVALFCYTVVANFS